MINDFAHSVYDILVHKGYLSTAESFTGGAVCAELVKISGMSELLKKGLVCYSNESKINDLKVDSFIIDKYGAVSEQTAKAMLDGIINCGYDFAIATTGNAGPTSEKEDEVGVCYIGVATKNDYCVQKFRFDGDREFVIKQGTQKALECASEFFSKKLENI